MPALDPIRAAASTVLITPSKTAPIREAGDRREPGEIMCPWPVNEDARPLEPGCRRIRQFQCRWD
jgi:hypothetical protein